MNALRVALLGALVGAPLAAQDTVVIIRQPLARIPVERRAVTVFNAAETMRILGSYTIGGSTTVESDVAVLDGPLRIEGRVMGDVVAINADLEVAGGASIDGDVLVLGGRARVSEDGRVGGAIEQHTTRVDARLDGDRLEIRGRDRPAVIHHDGRREHRLPRSRVRGRASLVVTSGGTYNRVEGLPVLAGPRITWTSRHVAARLEGMGIFRTAASLDLDSRDVGYRVLGRLRLGGNRALEFGARAFDQVQPIEDWTLRDDEIGWSTFLLHRDYRDYFLARGVGAHARWRAGPVVSAWIDASRYDATSIAARDPWTPFRNSDVWRANSAIDEGRFTEYRVGFELSTPGHGHASGGVRLRAEWLRGTSDSVVPVLLPAGVRAPLPAAGYRYDRVWADLRLYQAFAGGALSLRGVAGGDVGQRDPLPVQRRVSLGGPDPMPGYGFRRFACNSGAGDPASPALCDRMVLLQAEFRTGLSVDVVEDEDEDDSWWGWGNWDFFDGDDFHLVVFSDAGAAWLGTATPKRLEWDVGAGFEVGGFGVYLSRSLETGSPVRAVIRLHRRF